MSKKELAVEEVKDIEAIANAMVRELDVLKKKITMLRGLLKEDESVIR
jgi:hypothetical protein